MSFLELNNATEEKKISQYQPLFCFLSHLLPQHNQLPSTVNFLLFIKTFPHHSLTSIFLISLQLIASKPEVTGPILEIYIYSS